MKKKTPPQKNTQYAEEQLAAGRYVWTQYSFYGTPDEISFGAEPIEQKLSHFEASRPLLFSAGTDPSFSMQATLTEAECAWLPSRSPLPSSCAIPINGSVLQGSIALHHGKYLLTDNGETVRQLRKAYGVSDDALQRILGNMKTEQKVCVIGGELCIVLPNLKKPERYAKDLALIIERLLLVCRMTLS